MNYNSITFTRVRFNMLEKLTLRKFHPRKIFFDVVAMIWAVYFLWLHDWRSALIVTAALGTVGYLTVWNINLKKMSETRLGKIGLLHLHPFNLVTQLVGFIPLVHGIWAHSTEFILAGLSLVFIGHIYGWDEVDPAFSVGGDKS